MIITNIYIGDHPFIVVKNWKEINEIIRKYTSNPDSLELKQKEVFEWYKNFKIKLSKDTEKYFTPIIVIT